MDSRRNARPLVLPDTFSGEGDFTEWTDHFESVADVNEWDDAEKLRWLKVRLTSRALTAFKRFPEAARMSYAAAQSALQERFDPASRRELYVVEFQTRKKNRDERWADFGEDLRILADKAYPDLQEEARERLSLNRYLDQLSDPQVAFAVRQSTPKSVDEAVTATLRLESYKIRPAKLVGLVSPEPPTESLTETSAEEALVGAVGAREKPREKLQRPTGTDLLQSLVERIERLETRQKTESHYQGGRRQGGRFKEKTNDEQRQGQARRERSPIICYRCGKEGHYARGCATRKATGPGNA